MIDRYTKTVLTIIAIALLMLTVQLQSRTHVAAQQSKPSPHCVWTYITDQGKPNIGKNGFVDLKDADWKKMSEEGWQLKVTGQEGSWVFERCD
jgi:hypothetical protein